jgi:cation diffusion facilitator CzcD-associated flavoprotein CzcO
VAVSVHTSERKAPDGSHSRIVVIGAGFGGIGLAIKFQEAGVEDFTILERADELGGTWRDNTYPGCACDVASHLYSYSFAPNPDWSHAYSRQEEILEYLRAVAAQHDVERYVRYGTELIEASWDEEGSRWRLETSRGPMNCDILVPAMGPFGDPVMPTIPGVETFAGRSFHSLHWDHEHDLSGVRVAVIGTGASAVQFIPRIQPEVGELKVFQRTAPWIMPRFDRRTSRLERKLMRRFPALRQAIRGCLYTTVESLGLAIWVDRRFATAFEALGRWQLRRQVPDPELRRRLTPDYRIGCKRAILSDNYLPALQRPNVEVITDRITEIRERSVVTADGREHPVDTIIYGTGFDVPTRQIARFRGRHGQTLAEVYSERPQSYLGTTIAGFPNLFLMLGPFAAGGNQSALYMLESQIAYVVDAVRKMSRNGRSVVEVRPEVQDAFVAEMNERSEDTVWLTGGCKSYYTTPDGRNAGLWPNWTFRFRRRTASFDESDYELRSAA